MPTAPTGRRVALVTLGCARNEVDSEELAGRLAADGWLLVAEPADADVALVNTCGFVEAAKKDSIDTLLAAADLKERWPHPGGGRRRLPRRAVRRGAGRGAAGGRRGARLRRLRRHLRPAADHPRRRGARPAHPAGPRALLPLAPADRRRPRRPARAAGPAGRAGARVRAAAAADAARRRPDCRAEARLRLRPALHLLRDPAFRGSFVSRPPARGAGRGRAGWPTRACASWCW